MTAKPAFRKVLKSIDNEEKLLPILRTFLWDPNFKGFTVKVQGFTHREPDGWFHPSTHPLWTEPMLYLYLSDPKSLIREPFDPTSTMAVTAGNFFHTFIQTVLLREGILEKYPDCPCGYKHSEAEVELVDPETRSRGHSDGVTFEGDGFEFKGIDVSTPILTTAGWKTMGEVEEGDEVFAPDGHPTKVIGAHDPRMVGCYRLTFEDGQEVVTDEDHLWEVDEVVSSRVERKIVETREMVGNTRWSDRWRYRVHIPSPVQMDEADLLVDPWLLGAWLGDGSSNEGLIHVGEEDLDYMVDSLEALGERIRIFEGRTAYRIQVYGLRGKLSSLGVLNDKHIPYQYLMASESQRRELLAGIMDTDGTVGNGRQCVVTMKSKRIMEGVTQLVRGLGWKAILRSHQAWLGGREVGEVWKVQFHAGYGDPFLMPRKRDKIQLEGVRVRAGYITLRKIEEVPSRPTRCLTVAHESSMYLVGEGFLPTHNTMNTNKMWRIPRGKPDDPDVVDWLRDRCPDYYAQAQEYLRLSQRQRMIVVLLSMNYPFEMREIHVSYDHLFSTRVRDKFRRVVQAVADQRFPRCECLLQSKSCPARGVCHSVY